MGKFETTMAISLLIAIALMYIPFPGIQGAWLASIMILVNAIILLIK